MFLYLDVRVFSIFRVCQAFPILIFFLSNLYLDPRQVFKIHIQCEILLFTSQRRDLDKSFAKVRRLISK